MIKKIKLLLPFFTSILIFSVISCATTSVTVSSDITEKYPLLPVEEIIASTRTVQELMSDTRQYFKKNYVDISTNATQVDATLISMRFFPTIEIPAGNPYIYTCDFTVIVEFKDDGRIRFSTEGVYIGLIVNSYSGKNVLAKHDWFYSIHGVKSEEARIEGGKIYNQIVNEMLETIHRIAAGKNEYTW